MSTALRTVPRPLSLAAPANRAPDPGLTPSAMHGWRLGPGVHGRQRGAATLLQHDRGRYLVQDVTAAMVTWLTTLLRHGRAGEPPEAAVALGLQQLGLVQPVRATITLVGGDRLTQTLERCLDLAGIHCRAVRPDRWLEVAGAEGLVVVAQERCFDPAPCWWVARAHLPLLVAEVNHRGARFGQFLAPGSLQDSPMNWSNQFDAVGARVDPAPTWLLEWLVQRCATTALSWLETASSARPDRWSVLDRQAVGVEAVTTPGQYEVPLAA